MNLGSSKWDVDQVLVLDPMVQEDTKSHSQLTLGIFSKSQSGMEKEMELTTTLKIGDSHMERAMEEDVKEDDEDSTILPSNLL